MRLRHAGGAPHAAAAPARARTSPAPASPEDRPARRIPTASTPADRPGNSGRRNRAPRPPAAAAIGEPAARGVPRLLRQYRNRCGHGNSVVPRGVPARSYTMARRPVRRRARARGDWSQPVEPGTPPPPCYGAGHDNRPPPCAFCRPRRVVLAACGNAARWHGTDITGAMPELEFTMTAGQ